MFTAEQQTILRRPIAAQRVLEIRGKSYLATWDVRAHLTRVFGFGNWDFHVVGLKLADARDDNNRYWATYSCVGRLTVWNLDHTESVTYEDAAVGTASNQPSAGDAHDLAVKSAVSGAIKRCAVNLGTQFGLSLYAGTHQDVIRKLVTDNDDEIHDTPTVIDDSTDEPIGDYS